MAKVNKNRDSIREIFQEACSQREMLIFVTPFLRFESNFVHLDDDEVHATVMMGKEVALYDLRFAEIKLRFPHKFTFLEAPVKLMGFGLYEGRRTIRFELPGSTFENDDRKAYRVESVGTTIATLQTKDYLIHANLVNLSTTGARLSALDTVLDAYLKVNDKVILNIPLQDVIEINNIAVVRHMEYKAFGVEFNPRLPDKVLDPLSRWAFKMQEKEREILVRRLELSDLSTDIGSNIQGAGGIVVLTREDLIGSVIEQQLSAHQDVCVIRPAFPTIKAALQHKPKLIIIHVAETDIDERRLLKSLVESIPANIPILLLGTEVSSEYLFELGQEWKVASSIIWTPEKNIFLQRLILGMLRSRYGQS